MFGSRSNDSLRVVNAPLLLQGFSQNHNKLVCKLKVTDHFLIKQESCLHLHDLHLFFSLFLCPSHFSLLPSLLKARAYSGLERRSSCESRARQKSLKQFLWMEKKNSTWQTRSKRRNVLNKNMSLNRTDKE